MKLRSLTALATVGLVAVSIGAVMSQAATTKPAAPAKPAPALKALAKATAKLPKSATSTRARALLVKHVAAARSAAAKRPCASVRSLAAYRKVLRGIRTPVRGTKSQKLTRARNARLLAAVGASSTNATRLLLADKRTKPCGGGAVTTSLAAADATIGASDDKRLGLAVALPDLRLTPMTGGGRSWTRLAAPDTDAPQAPGQPGIPTISREFAVPVGATVSVKATATSSYTMSDVDVFPAQPTPVDGPADTTPPDFRSGRFLDGPFAFDARAYASTRPFPADQANVVILGQSRDLTVGVVRVPLAQYNAATRSLTVLQGVKVDITFTGGEAQFGTDDSSPWDRLGAAQSQGMINAAAISKWRPRVTVRPCGEEFLVITHPLTLDAATTLAAARSSAGIRTKVVQTGTIGDGRIGTTTTEIRDFIRAELAQTGKFGGRCVRPSYIGIVGDDKLVPTFAGPSGIPSDLEYSLKDAADLLPDVAIGRIIANDQSEAQAAVDKIVRYETTPPTGDFLKRALIAAEFQDDGNTGQESRTFIQFAERVSNGLKARGVHVDRAYGRDGSSAIPARFNDGTPLPTSLLPPFAWDGDADDVTASWNQGDFLVVHRDHGWSDGWSTPFFTTSEVNTLTNGANLPVVMSVNCSSAAYDYDDTSLAQSALVKPDGGAVGVFGDTRDSPTWHNSQIALGFVDALLPSVIPDEGSPTKQRVGDALVTGKRRLAGIAPPPDGNTINEMYLWHYFGDPTMQMWGGGTPPINYSTLVIKTLAYAKSSNPGPDDPPYKVTVAGLPAEVAGQAISLLYKGDVVGKAVATAGEFEIPATFGDAVPLPGQLRVAFEADGAAPASFPVTVPEPEPNPPAPTPLPTPELPQPVMMISCPATPYEYSPMGVSGTLSMVPEGTAVSVAWTSPTGINAANQTATTSASGAWTANSSPPPGGLSPKWADGTWTITASFAANASFKSAQQSCATFVM